MNRFYAIYARQSIDKADSISIETQIERCLFEVGSEKYRVYCDRGYSGKNTSRPQFQSMLNAVNRGEICCIICYKLDRCSRSILDFAQLMDSLQRCNVSFISCTEKFDTSTPMGRAMLNICIVFAQLERETIQQRITDAYHSRCKKGYYMGGRVPFGFKLEPYYLEDKKTARYAVVDSERKILELIYSLYKEPSTSLSDVVSDLNSRKIQNPRRDDGLWIRPHISRMIKNPIYVRADQRIYDYYQGKGIVFDNPIEDFMGYNGCYLYHIDGETHLVLAPHEGIIPSDIWLKCQKTKPNGNRTKETHLSWLTGKLQCRKCGRAIALRQCTGKNGHIYRYFLCSGARGKNHLCEGFRPIPVEIIERSIKNAIIERIKLLSESILNDNREKLSLQNTLQSLLRELDTGNLSEVQLRLALADLHFQPDHSTDEFHEQDPETWDYLVTEITRWSSLSHKKKTRIADACLFRAELSELQIRIHWRV